MPIRELNRPPKKATERTMKISDLAGPETNDLSAAAAIDATGIASDSRKVKPGDLFVAVAGTRADGSDRGKSCGRSTLRF